MLWGGCWNSSAGRWRRRERTGGAVNELAYGEILDRVAQLAESLLEHPSEAVRDEATELLDWLDVYHREGLGRLVEMIRDWRGEVFLDQVAADPIVGELLATYGLGVDADAATLRLIGIALDEVRPYVHSHGGELEVVSAVDGVVTLRMHGTCDGCTAADDTVAGRIEVALREHWVEFRRVVLTEATAPAHPPPTAGGGSVASGLQISPRP